MSHVFQRFKKKLLTLLLLFESFYIYAENCG